MSLESNIATLTAEVIQAKTQFTDILPELIQAKNDALNVAVNLKRSIHLDAINGDDGNAGTSSSKVQSLAKALQLIPSGMTASIYYYSDIYVEESFQSSNRLITLHPFDIVNPPIIFISKNGRFDANLGGMFNFPFCDIDAVLGVNWGVPFKILGGLIRFGSGYTPEGLRGKINIKENVDTMDRVLIHSEVSSGRLDMCYSNFYNSDNLTGIKVLRGMAPVSVHKENFGNMDTANIEVPATGVRVNGI